MAENNTLRHIYRIRTQSTWAQVKVLEVNRSGAETPSWICNSGLVRILRLFKLEIRLWWGVPVDLSGWELGNPDFPVHLWFVTRGWSESHDFLSFRGHSGLYFRLETRKSLLPSANGTQHERAFPNQSVKSTKCFTDIVKCSFLLLHFKLYDIISNIMRFNASKDVSFLFLLRFYAQHGMCFFFTFYLIFYTMTVINITIYQIVTPALWY